MKRCMKYVVVLSIVAGGVLFTSLQDKFWVWADDGIFNIICKNKGIEDVNLLMIAHGGQEKPVLPGEKEDDPGARTIGYSTYPDSDVLYKSELMRLFILGACVPEDVSPDATVKLDLLHNDGERIRLWEDQTTPPPPIPLPTDFSLQDISLYKSVWVEATTPSKRQGDITICAKLIDPEDTSDETTCQDTVTATAVLVNLSIDSDNTNGLQEPDDSEDEDRIEDDPTKSGKILVVNTWDMNHDGIPNFADGFTTEKFHNAGNTAGGNFVPLVLTLLPDSIDWTNAQVKFHYDASDPGDVGYDDHQTPDDPSDDTYSLPQQGHLRLWTKDGVANRHIDDDYIQSGVAYNITDLLSGDGYTIPLYVEGVQASPADSDLRRIHVDLDPTGEGQFVEDVDAVRVTVVAATDITIYKPESVDFTEPLEWGEVIFRDELVRVKVTLSSEIPSLELFRDTIDLRIFLEETETDWRTIPFDGNDTLFAKKEIRIIVTWEELTSFFGLLPPDPADSEWEFTSVGLITDANSKLDDENAFDELMENPVGYERRGRARKDTDTTDTSETYNGKEHELISPVTENIIRAGGVQFIQFRAPGQGGYVTSASRHIQNQADYFYYSGHGRRDGGIAGGLWKPDLAQQHWKYDLDTLIFAGCSVLTINDYARRWLYRAFYHPTKRDASAALVIPRTLGDQWRQPDPHVAGPQVFLGYQYSAPRDTQGADSIIADWVLSKRDADAWMDANSKPRLVVNLTRPGLNACAVDFREKPWTYQFFWDDELEKKVGEVPEGICEANGRCLIEYDYQEQRWPPLLTYPTTKTYMEVQENDGSIDNTKPLVLTVTGDSWNGIAGENFWPGKIDIQPALPEGLTAEIMPISSDNKWQLIMRILGKATHHEMVYPTPYRFSLVFQDEAFESGEPVSTVIGYDNVAFTVILH